MTDRRYLEAAAVDRRCEWPDEVISEDWDKATAPGRDQPCDERGSAVGLESLQRLAS